VDAGCHGMPVADQLVCKYTADHWILRSEQAHAGPKEVSWDESAREDGVLVPGNDLKGSSQVPAGVLGPERGPVRRPPSTFDAVLLAPSPPDLSGVLSVVRFKHSKPHQFGTWFLQDAWWLAVLS
jgi:hypothetical protein